MKESKLNDSGLLLYVATVMVIGSLLSACTPPGKMKGTPNPLSGSGLVVYGRHSVSKLNTSAELITTAAHFGFTVEGRACSIRVSLPDWLSHNYIQYEVDGKYQKRIRINSRNEAPVIIDLGSEGNHDVWIYKATEAHTGPVFVHDITGKNVKAITKKPAPLIEFIGNSITCGAAADPSEVPCGTGVYHDQHNAYMSYGPRLSRVLGNDFIISSVSGIGIYRNWNSDGPVMPQVYDKLDFQADGKRLYSFEKQPDVVSIALGTNDFSGGDGVKKRLPFDSAAFVNGYASFVQQVRSTYKDAKIILLSSPMLTGERRTRLQNCLMAVKTKMDEIYPSQKIELYFFQPMRARGCTGHPSVEDHAVLAEELIPVFRKLLQP